MSKSNPTPEDGHSSDGEEQSDEKIPRLLASLLKDNSDVTVYTSVNSYEQYWVRFSPQHNQFEVAEAGPGKIELQRVPETRVRSLFGISRVDLQVVEEATDGCRDIWKLVDAGAEQVELVDPQEESR